jgi:hypothetical protein
MGQVKELYADVAELLETTDMTVEEIADTLDCDEQFVEDVLYDLGLDNGDGQPDEMTEWHDFDPDC